MTYKGRKRLSLLILVVGVPAYIMLAVTVMSTAPRFPWVIEFFIYGALGSGWVFPLKWVFKGIGQPDPDQ